MRWIPMDRVMQSYNLVDLSRHYQCSDPYAQAWAALHYFSADEHRMGRLLRFLQLTADRVRHDHAVREGFGMSIDVLDTTLKEYSKREEYQCAVVKPVPPLESTHVDFIPLTGEQWQVRVGDLLLATVGPSDAALRLLSDVSQRTPRDGRARAALARALFLRSQRDTLRAELDAITADDGQGTAPSGIEALQTSLKALREALTLSPEDPEVQVVAGHVETEHAVLLEDHDPQAARAALTRARKHYRRAIKADEAMGEAYFGLGKSYLARDPAGKMWWHVIPLGWHCPNRR